MIATKLDIYNKVTTLSLDLVKPTTIHLTKVKYVLSYLNGTKKLSLIFKKSQNPLNLE